jgi:hypothetical protein
LGLLPDPTQKPTYLKVADDRIIQCDWTVVNVEILTITVKGGPSYLERVTFYTVDIGGDDIILGDPSLKTHESGHEPLGTNTWKMVEAGVTYLIPLMKGGDSNIKGIETVKGTKKIKKIIREHTHQLMRGHVWRRDEPEDNNPVSQRPPDLEFNSKHRNSMLGLPWSFLRRVANK